VAQILDPVCDMIVDVEQQRSKGLTSELLGKTYAFCSAGCKKTFDADPGKFTAAVSAWEASGAPGTHEHGGHAH
jgi:Cu+-exporting ATPase